MALLAIYGVVSTMILFWPVLAGALLVVEAGQGEIIRYVVSDPNFRLVEYLRQPILFWSLIAIFGLILSLAPLTLQLQTIRAEKWVLRAQNIIGAVIVVLAAVAVWKLIPLLFRAVDQMTKLHFSPNALPAIATVLGVIAMIQRLWAYFDSAPASKLKRAISYVVMALVGPALAVVLFVWLGEEWVVGRPSFDGAGIGRLVWLSFLTFVPLSFRLFLDVNTSSLYPFYRRKLSDGYLFVQERTPDGGDGVRADEGIKLSELRSRNPSAPYHLINCALNAPSGHNAAVRGRGTDFFLFSQKYSGSAATRYFETTAWEQQDAHLNLATAMAISAAAASPFMGVASIPGGNLLLTLFNIRLDYWLAVPGRRKLSGWLWRAGPWYLLRQALGWLDDQSWFVNVTDGGCIENLGIYELFRRRCKFIVAIDGECDPHIQCGSLMQLVRYALIDFGIAIKIDMSRFKRSPAGTVPFHFALAKVEYPKLNADSLAAIGHLLYIKLSCTGNEPPHVKYYQSQHPEFPHELTADQFFSEDQFEAYRALGEHAANDLFSIELLGDKTPPVSLNAWFAAISLNLEGPRKK
jgi:hypothetical protein